MPEFQERKQKDLLPSLRNCLSESFPELTIAKSCPFSIAVENQNADFCVDLALLSQEEETPHVAAVWLLRGMSRNDKNQIRTRLQYMTKRHSQDKQTIYWEHFLVGCYCEIDYPQHALRLEYYVDGKVKRKVLLFF